MKKLLISSIFFFICTYSFAVDFSSINDESIKEFINLFSKYTVIVKDINSDLSPVDPLPQMYKSSKEIEKLFSVNNMSINNFQEYLQKVSVGLASIQMKESGLDNDMIQTIMGQFNNNLNEKELATLEKYKDRLLEIFEE